MRHSAKEACIHEQTKDCVNPITMKLVVLVQMMYVGKTVAMMMLRVRAVVMVMVMVMCGKSVQEQCLAEIG